MREPGRVSRRLAIVPCRKLARLSRRAGIEETGAEELRLGDSRVNSQRRQLSAKGLDVSRPLLPHTGQRAPRACDHPYLTRHWSSFLRVYDTDGMEKDSGRRAGCTASIR